MPTLQKYTKYSLWIFAIVFLTGCSFGANFFIVNKTHTHVTAILKFREAINELLRDSFKIQLKYADTLLNINDDTRNQLTKRLKHTTLTPTTIAVVLPPKSTILIGSSSNSIMAADSVILITSTIKHEYSRDDLDKKVNRTGGLLPPFHFTYTIQ